MTRETSAQVRARKRLSCRLTPPLMKVSAYERARSGVADLTCLRCDRPATAGGNYCHEHLASLARRALVSSMDLPAVTGNDR